MAGLFKWGVRRDDPPAAARVDSPDPLTTSKVLPRVIAALGQRPSPVVMDLGPVVGQNIAFFGEQISCKIFIENLFAPVDEHLQRGGGVALPPAALPSRLTHASGSLDGIFCWDLFDFLDRKAAQALATRLVELLKPGGILYAFFGATNGEITQYTRFLVESSTSYRLKLAPCPPCRRHVLVNRDINKMFEGLAVSESVLLKTNSRETLFRKS